MKLAILYSGPYRGTSDILNNHINTFGNDVDMYVSCFEHYLEDWKNSGWPVKEYFITPNVEFKETNWFKYRNDGAGQSGFWQFWNLRNVMISVPKKYDFYIKNRNDLIFDKPFQFNASTDNSILNKNTFYCSKTSFHKKDNWDTNNWLNDEFYLGCENTINVISNFVTNYYDSEENQHQTNFRLASNETQLRRHLIQNNVDIKTIHNFSYVKNHYGKSSPSGCYGFQLEKI